MALTCLSRPHRTSQAARLLDRSRYITRTLHRLPAVLPALAVVAALGSCGTNTPEETVSGGSPPGQVTPGCFTGGQTPQLDLFGPDPDWTWNDPHLLKVGGQYRMYASATDNFVPPVLIYRLVSGNGSSWTRNPATPVLTESGGGEWDAHSAETPAVVIYGGQYHLFYTGYTNQADTATYAIGHATSPDGITFTKDPANPIAAPTGNPFPTYAEFDQFIVAEPAPVVVGGKLRLYFTALGVDLDLANTLQTIGMIEFDGTSWSAPVQVLKPDQAVYPRTADWLGYSTPNATVLGGEVHLFVDVAHQPDGGAWTQRALHHARSANGLTGWIQDGAPIFVREDFAWTARGIRSPAPLLDGTKLRLYFAGDSLTVLPPQPGENFGIGMATCNLGL